MKWFIIKFLFFIGVVIICISCQLKKTSTLINTQNIISNDTIMITNKNVDYEIIIIDPGFNIWLQSTAQAKGYYSQNYLEIKNNIMATNWDIRVLTPNKYSSNLYTMRIDYDINVNYGYKVNYLLYNYFLYFQQEYNQNLTSNTN